MQTPATTPAATEATRTYPGTPDQIAVVRADLRGLLAGCPVADDAILCASELAANAVLHSDSRMPGVLYRSHRDLPRRLHLDRSRRQRRHLDRSSTRPHPRPRTRHHPSPSIRLGHRAGRSRQSRLYTRVKTV